MKKLFGEIDLTWKKLIIFAIIIAIYTAAMTIVPITKDTSFRDIASTFEWWILFGVIIIYNSKSNLDSALKCFVFFLISQPLIYLFQVPFSWQGWGIFSYYKYWFIWTILTLPMGYIGYYIKKDNFISLIIILPMLILLALTGLTYLNSCIENFPSHLLTCIACLMMIIVITLGVLKKPYLRIICFIITGLFITINLYLNLEVCKDFREYKALDEYNITGEVYLKQFSGSKKGNVEVQHRSDFNILVLSGKRGGKYTFTISDESEGEYSFEYYYDKKSKSVVLNKISDKD